MNCFLSLMVLLVVIEGRIHKGRSLSQLSCPFPRDYVKPYQIDPNHPIIQTALKQVQQLFFTSMNASSLAQSAMSLAIVVNQTLLWSGGVGTMDYRNASAPAPDGDTIYKIASQTKVITSFMLLKLRDAGLLSLEDPVMKRFPKFKLRTDPFGTNSQITLRHLASQLSGIPRESPCGWTNPPPPNCTETADVWSIIAEKVDPIFPPATLPSYSNLGFAILGRGLEGLVGIPYEQWVETNILQPLKMTSSGFEITEQIAARIPTIVGPLNTPWPKITSLGWSNPCGQMYSSVNDIAKFMMNLFNDKDESVFLKSSVRESLTPQWVDFSATGGFGFPYEILYLDDLWVMTKDGGLPGHNSKSLYVKELKVGVTMSISPGYGLPFPLEMSHQFLVMMVEAVKKVVAIQQATLTYPPPPQIVASQVVGCYTGFVLGDNETTSITEATNKELVIDGFPLYYRYQLPQGYLFQIGMAPTGTCLTAEGPAEEGQWVHIIPSGSSFYLTFPTFVGGDVPYIKGNCPQDK